MARTRFYVPPGMLAKVLRHADPVITSNGDRLRFESLSPCCGVYARLDVLPDGLDRAPAASGTTNVDLNAPVRAVLATLVGAEPLHLEVGQDVTVTTLDGSAVERRVPLPARWLAAFGEVQHACAGLRPVAEVDGQEARRFVQAVATGTGSSAADLVATSGRGLRLTGRPGTDTVPLPGPDRLRARCGPCCVMPSACGRTAPPTPRTRRRSAPGSCTSRAPGLWSCSAPSAAAGSPAKVACSTTWRTTQARRTPGC